MSKLGDVIRRLIDWKIRCKKYNKDLKNEYRDRLNQMKLKNSQSVRSLGKVIEESDDKLKRVIVAKNMLDEKK